jgi:hypothetical protein
VHPQGVCHDTLLWLISLSLDADPVVRAIIATDFRGELRKLVWLTENNTGVSAGICESGPDPHATYHVDGRYHHKIRSKGRLLTLAPEKRVPLRSISTKAQLFGTAAFYTEAIMKRLPVFRPNRRVDALLVLGQSVFSDIACASFNIYVVHRSHEAKFVSGAYSSYEDSSFMVVAVNLFGLHIFTDHQLGVIIYKGKKSPRI